MDEKNILKQLDYIDDLPTLPAIAMEVNRMLEDYDTSIKQLSKTIEKDQSIVSKILKLVNSAFFGLRSKISTISHAVTLLGFNTVRNAVISVSIVGTLSGEKISEDFDMTGFWTHSVAVAVTSRALSEQTRLHSPDDCFIGGLLHDIGKIVLASHFHDLFKKVWTLVKESNISFYEAEKQEIPLNHAIIGGHLAKKWQLPLGLTDAIRCHHAVSGSANDLDLLMIIQVANAIVNSRLNDPGLPIDSSALHPQARGILKSQLVTLSDWFPAVSTEIDSACQLFLEDVKK